ncbi:hypothetical protein MMC07_005226 [Pseudocyphellaria aurata]|nr:hypothetical protein [Pseudocyphellaria aurata]
MTKRACLEYMYSLSMSDPDDFGETQRTREGKPIGYSDISKGTQKDTQEQLHEDSLFYIFNTLPSPSPSPADVFCPFAKAAMISLLNAQPMPGLKTNLYAYQKRSAAEMVRRETRPLLRLDPRFETIDGPTGRQFYYDEHTGFVLREKQEYEEVQGGILAETMGLGKTLICLATILATKGHWPQIPPEYSTDLHPIRPKVGSLMQMAAAAVNRQKIPWRTYFQDLSESGEHYGGCVAALEETISSYVIPDPVTRGRKKGRDSKGQRVHLCSATLILVPPNLFLQWKNEIALHFTESALKVLFMESSQTEMPSRAALMSYDIILMTKKRFEQEFSVIVGGATPYTPLKELHFLRIIADEGHAFASRNNAVWALQNIHVDRRWIISGTPTANLLGVEVDLATNETSREQLDSLSMQSRALINRQRAKSFRQERQDVQNLGSIVVNFLYAKPWANSWGSDPVSWHTYIVPDHLGRRKARCLRSILEGLIVRHQIEAVEKDVPLPPLYNRVVYLQPSWHDKLSISLFVLTLTANAVTSERVDQDYMFHPRNKKQLEKLITNLRQSGFYWTGFTSQDIGKTLEVSADYLEKPVNCRESNTEDRLLLAQAMDVGRLALESRSWNVLTELNELGFYVDAFPEDAYKAWSLIQGGKDDVLVIGPTQLVQTQKYIGSRLYFPNSGAGLDKDDVLVIGATQLIQAQKYIGSRLYFPNPGAGLDVFGITTMERLQQSASQAPERPKLTKTSDNPKAITSKHRQVSDVQGKNPTKATSTSTTSSIGEKDLARATKPLKSAMKASRTIEPGDPLSPNSSLAKTRIVGTASAKLSYLIDQVVLLHQDEKILIFYEGDQIAYYVAQAFDLIDVGYRIYTGTLSVAERNDYIDTFNMDTNCRVMLMKVSLAAHGLHLASASRVFFVNPVWQPNVEAQAIKRAHRIGQTRPVHVETLVLKDTVEDRMFQRRKAMTTEEHQTARKSLLDDPVIREIIQTARPLPFTPNEVLQVRERMAPLATAQRLFGRGGKRKADDFDSDTVAPPSSRRKFQENSSSDESRAMNGGRFGSFDGDDRHSYSPSTGENMHDSFPVGGQLRRVVRIMSPTKSPRRSPFDHVDENSHS